MTKRAFRVFLIALAVLQCLSLAIPALQGVADGGVVFTAEATSVKKTAKITKQPSSVRVAKGQTAKVTVKATGDGLSYKWYFKDSGKTKFSLTTSFTGNSYSVKMNADRKGRQVYCVVTDKYGNSVKSNVVTLNMGKTLKITTQPKSVAKPAGQTAEVTLAAYGDGLTYKWYYKDTGSSKFKVTKTFTGTKYTAQMTSARNGRQIYCVVTDKYGKKVKSDVVTLSISSSLKVTKQPASVAVAGGQTAKVTIAASGDGLTYKWYYKDTGSSKFKLTKTFTGVTYTAQMTAARNGRQIYCVVGDKYGNTVKTNTVTLSMTSSLKITKQPESVTKPAGESAVVTLTASGEGMTYKWYYKDPGSSSFKLTKTFVGPTYAVEMSSARSGRQVYCVVTDKYGNSVKTNTATLTMAKALKITEQLTSASVHTGERVTVSFTASGDGLTYKWYYKERGKSAFSYTKTFTGNSYSIEMSNARNGRQVYCVVTDKYGQTVKTNTVTLSAAHKYGSWVVRKEATVEATGTERRTCQKCDHYEERTIAKLKAVTYITVDPGTGKTYKVGVAANGKYTLKAPTKVGYDFAGWQTSAGKEFAAEGVYTKNISIKATWKLANTTTMAQLVERTDAGVDRIKIAGNITVNGPLFISHKVHIYSDGDYTITRDPSYKGDIFVVGETRDGSTAVMENRTAELTLGGGKGTLTIDGNKSKLKVTVAGSAIYVANTGVVNLQDGVVIANHKKLANERALTNTDFTGETPLDRCGGAAVQIINGTVNMYGGIIENCEVFSETVDEAGNPITTDVSSSGGAVYTRGNFNMYGGIIRNNLALRGGAIYNDRYTMLYAGTITGNSATTYAGAICSSASSLAQTFIGCKDHTEPMIVSNNSSQKAGGAVYSNTHSPIVVYQNAIFDGNSTQSIGGAIYTGGPLTVYGATFKGNESPAQGGAIFHNFSNAEADRRFLEIDGAYFEDNLSWDGGAIALGAYENDQNLGTYAVISNSVFKKNRSFGATEGSGSGGAIYASARSEAQITGCTFEENASGKVAGALYVHKDSIVSVSSSTFHKNTATYGGAINVASGTLTASKLTMTENTATYGGAFFLNPATITITDLKASGNAATSTGGVLNTEGGNVTISGETELKNNTAASRGGAIYITKAGDVASSFTMTGGVLQGNTAGSGGAVSVRSTCSAAFDGTSFRENASTDENTENSLYIGGGALDALSADVSLSNVTMSDNTSANYGGAVLLHGGSEVAFKNITFTGNTAKSAGAIYFCDTTPSVTTATFSENTAIESAGALLVRGASTEVTLTGANFDKNSAANGGALHLLSGTLNVTGGAFTENAVSKSGYGGAILAGIATLNVNGTEFSSNTAHVGAAVSLSGTAMTVSGASEFTSNTVTNRGGAIDVTYQGETVGTLTITGGLFENNSAALGGAINVRSGNINIDGAVLSGNTATERGAAVSLTAGTVELKNVTASKNTAIYGGAINVAGGELTATNLTLNDNTATYGGAMFISPATVTITGLKASGNEATSTGGVLNTEGGIVTISGESELKNNTAATRGGALYITKSGDVAGSLTMTGGILQGNTAGSGGAASVRSTCSAAFNGTSFLENASTDENAENSLYVGGGALDALSADVSLTDVALSGNTSANYGGAVLLNSGAKVAFENITASKNTAKTAGAIFVCDSTPTITGATFSENSASYAGAILVRGAKTVLTLTDSDFTKNTATYGGAIQVQSGAMNITGGAFTENAADSESGYGGAIISGIGNVSINGTKFTGNTAYVGAALSLNGTTMTVSGASEFKNNIAANRGGAIDVTYEGETIGALTVTGGLFEGNEASTGGAVCVRTGCSASFTGTQFKTNKSTAANTGNEKTVGGGAIYVHENGALTLVDTEFDGNTSENYGGAVMLNKASLTMTGGKIINSQSVSGTGAAIYLYLCEDSSISGTEISHNTAKWNGVVYSNAGTLTITDVTATGNTADHGGVFYISGGTAELTNVTATGNSAKNGGAVLADGASTVVNITSSTLTDNTVTGNGGAIIVKGGATVAIDGGEYNGNSADAASGGAAYVAAGSTLTVKNATVNSNTAGYGGAIAVCGGNLTVSGTTFKGNTATTRSGALEITDNSGEFINITITGGLFEGNEAPYGGAVATKRNYNVTFDGTEFKNNKAATNSTGGAVQIGAGSVTFKNVTATGNEAGYGGAVFADGGTVTVIGGTYTGNRANEKGGALHIEGTAALTVNGMTASGNYAYRGSVLSVKTAQALNVTGLNADANAESVHEGGSVLVDGATTVLNLTDCVIKNNTATNGGAICIKAGTLNIDGGEYSNNAASATASGGAIYASVGSVVTVKDATFAANSAGYGGAIAANGTVLTVSGTSQFKNNTAATRGGVFEIASSSGDYLDLTITGGLFEANEAPGGGVAAIKSNVNVLFDGCEFKSNKASSGAVVSVGSGNVELKNVTATANEGTYGGVAFANGGKVTVTGGTYTGNKAVEKGGAVYVEGSAALTVNGLTASANYAYRGSVLAVKSTGTLDVTGLNAGANAANVYEGGAILVEGATTVLNLTDCVVKNNTAKTSGGAICIKAGTLNIDGGEYSNNSAAYGGMVFGGGSSKITVSDSTVTENNASDKGGAIYIEGATLTVTDGLFEANTALNGGALVLRAGDTATITGTEFKNNQATAEGAGVGGAIYVYGAAAGSKATTLTLTNATFTENKANGVGGAIATNESAPSLNISATGCSFVGNQAGADGTSGKGGGALEIRNGNAFSNGDPTAVPIVFTSCTFTDNTSTGTGGAIDIRSASYVKIDGITATGNESTTGWNGAVIYATSANTRLYLTGTVTASGNKAGSSDTFAYVSTSPAHLYTDHSSSAEWVAMTYATAGTITFDLATMP